MTATITPNRADGTGPNVSGAVVLHYTLAALGRISAARGGEVGNSRRIHEVIPGSVVRGALAAAWWAGDAPVGANAAGFRELFESDLIVHQAVPGGMGLEPISARRCKYPTPACQAAWQDLAQQDKPLKKCPTCGGALDTGRGWAWTETPRTVHVTRTALAPDETARDEQLFTRRAVRSRTVLRGSVVVLNPHAHTEDLAWLTQPRELRIGGQRSHLGQAAWTCAQSLDQGALSESDASRTVSLDRVTIRTLSPLILIDDFGAPTLDLAPTLRRHWPSARVVEAWVRPARVSGWHVASGLPKPEDLACEAGSTFVIEGLPTHATRQLVLGLGLRRLEGFGEIEVVTTEGRLTAPRSAMEPAAASPADPLDQFIAVVPASDLRALLPKVADGIRSVLALRAGGARGEALASARDAVLRQPWAMQLGAGARTSLGALLALEDLATMRNRVDALREAHR